MVRAHEIKHQLGLLSSSDDEEQKESSSPEMELHRKSSRSVFELKKRSLPLGQPLKRFVKPRKEEKLKEKAHGGNENVRKDPSESFLERLSSDVGAEIAFLKSIVHYKSNFPFDDPFASDVFIKTWLQVNVSVNQLKETEDILIEKYEKRVMKIVQHSDYMESHDREALELGEKIWNRKDGTEFAYKLNEFAAKERESLKVGQEHDLSMYPFLRESLKFGGNASMPVSCERIVKEGLSLFGSSKMKELDNKWRELQVQEMELYLRRVDLILEQTKLILAAIKSSSLH